MFLHTILIFFCLFQEIAGWAQETDFLMQKKRYDLQLTPIDVIIPCADKDIETLELCIQGIKENLEVRRIIVISPYQLTPHAEWFDEKKYPFTPYDLALEIFGREEDARNFSSAPSRLGWIYQQLLKLYAPLVIPDISKNVLVIDADTIFLNPVQFQGPSGEGLYNPGIEYHVPYFEHMARLIPGLQKVYSHYSGISHHMLFQKEVIDDLFQLIEGIHHREPWKAICRCIDPHYVHYSSLSEYEIYFNFVLTRSDQMQIRPLLWEDVRTLSNLKVYKQAGYHYVSYHSYLR